MTVNTGIIMLPLILFFVTLTVTAHGGNVRNAADSIGYYLFKSTLSEDELGLPVLETSFGGPRTGPSISLNSLVHSIHHKAALIRQKESEYVELDNKSTRLAITYPDPQYIGISVDSDGIPRSFTSSFINYILSHLVPYKDFLIGIKSCSNASTIFKGYSSLHPELFYSILPDISTASSMADIKDVLSLVILSRGIRPINTSLLSDIRRKIAPKRLLVHVFAYKPSSEAVNVLTSLADTYRTLEDEDLTVAVGNRFLYRRHSTASVKIMVPPLGKEVIFAHLESKYDQVMGLHVSKDYLFSEVYSYNSDDSFVCLFEKSGRLLYQPSIEDLNGNEYFRRVVFKMMLRDRHGSLNGPNNTFIWKRVDTTPFIIMMVKNSIFRTKRVNSTNLFDATTESVTLEFHNQLETKLCRHFRSPANTDTGSLFLSGLAFKDPLNRPDPTNFMAYLNNVSSHNPGIRDGIKEEVTLVSQITPFWKAKAFDSGLNNYIVRRYIATLSGILYVYPGIRFPYVDMDPRMQDWFLKASKFPGKVSLTSPTLDPNGAGFIVTLSRSLSHNQYRTPRAAVGMDMTLGYMYKILINTLPACKESNDNRCFIFDHEGYVVVHPKLVKRHPNEKREKYHLTHLEPQIINDLLTFRSFARKTICKSRKDESIIHKRYEFNHSYPSSIASHSRNGCNTFEISPIPESNLFLGMVNNSNCKEGAPINFCPCNVEGDRCIICGSLELMECECPCTCTDPCFLHEDDSLLSCEEEPQNFDPVPVDLDYLSDLPECLNTDCGSRTKEEDCLGLLGCSWCREKLISSYGNSNWVKMESDAFCGTLDKCFDGKLGELSPYQLIDSTSQKYTSLGAFDEFRSSPIGPVAGGIMSLFLFLSISVYCYRYYVSGSSTSSSLTSSSDQVTRRLFDHGSIRTTDDEEDKRRPNYANGNVSSIEIPPNGIISPYRMNPEYRRPPPGTDSDHGYSTMTPFGDIDSDIAAVSNPHALRSFTYHSSNISSPRTPSPSMNNTTRQSLVEHNDPPDESVTVLGANQFIVAATIHMVDTQ